MTPHTCACGMHYLTPAPARWTERYPELKGKCPDCIANWIAENGEAMD